MKYLFLLIPLFASCATAKDIHNVTETKESPSYETQVYLYFDSEGYLVTGSKRKGELPVQEELNATLLHFQSLFEDLGIEDEFREIISEHKKTTNL